MGIVVGRIELGSRNRFDIGAIMGTYTIIYQYKCKSGTLIGRNRTVAKTADEATKKFLSERMKEEKNGYVFILNIENY